jgi:hypothetical protein
MICRVRILAAVACVLGGLAAAGCQKPSSTDTTDIDDILVTTVSPNPALADTSGDGRTYRVVRGNNQPDDILPYDWKTSFTIDVTFNAKADDDDMLTFPVKLSSATLKVQQATGGIVTVPTGSDSEHYEYVTASTGNTFGAIEQHVAMSFDVWYDLPSLKREALVTVTLAFLDDDGKSVTKAVEVKVAP